MIDKNDFIIEYKDKWHNKCRKSYITKFYKYKCSCNFCGKDKGYMEASADKRPCLNCSADKKKDINKYIKLAEKINCTLLTKKIESAHTKLEWQCNTCNNIFERDYHHAKRRDGVGCLTCTPTSENKVRTIFESIFNKQFPTVRPDFLKNPNTGYNLELDGYCKELKLAFEYDGRFHYEERNKTLTSEQIQRHGSLEITKQIDILKDNLCVQNGIILIRIPYWENTRLKECIFTLLREKGLYAESSK